MNAHWSDWLFWIGGWTLAGGGAILLIWAIRGDRSRGRRRCRKCWYDMVAAEADDGVWTCPECGKRADRIKHLSKSRRRWRSALLASLFLLVAYPLGLVPVIRQHGWIRAVPSSVLVFIAPIEEQDLPTDTYMSLTVTQVKPQSTLLKELLARAGSGELARWQYQTLIDRIIRAEPLFLRGALWTRDTWPVEEPLFIDPLFIHPLLGQTTMFAKSNDWMFRLRDRGGSRWIVASPYDRWLSSEPSHSGETLGPFPAGMVDLEGEILVGVEYVRNDSAKYDIDMSNARVVWRGSLGQIEIVGPLEDHIVPYDTPAASKAVAGLIKGVTTASDGHPQLIIRHRNRHIEDGDVDWGLGFHAEILVDDRVVARGSGLYQMYEIGTSWMDHRRAQYSLDLAWTAGPVEIKEKAVTVRLTDDPSVAIRDLTRTVFWSGEVTVPITARSPNFSEEEERVRQFFLERDRRQNQGLGDK